METNVNYTIVGAFVITLLLAIVFSIIWLSSDFSITNQAKYYVYMKESVAGLSIDSPVEFNGVNVGAVKNIKISPNDPQLVKLVLNIKANTPITQGTTATISGRGFTGISYVALKDKSTNLNPLVKKPGQKYPVIPSAPSLYVRIDTALSILTENFHDVAQSLQKLLNPENQESINKILHNMQRITGELAANNRRMTDILRNTQKVTQQITPFIQSGNNALKTLQSQTLPATYELLNNLESMTRTLKEVAEELKDNPSVLIRGTDRQTLGPGEKR